MDALSELNEKLDQLVGANGLNINVSVDMPMSFYIKTGATILIAGITIYLAMEAVKSLIK